MNHDGLEYVEQEASVDTRQQKSASPNTDPVGKRVDPRCELATQAFVAIPPLTSRACDVHEISRGGMFLAFKDARTTWLQLEQANIGVGANADVAFAVSLDGKRHQFSVRTQIVRITKQGIGLQFVTRNPPQLAALRDLFPKAADQTGSAGSQQSMPLRSGQTRVVQKPSDTSGWKDWELLD